MKTQGLVTRFSTEEGESGPSSDAYEVNVVVEDRGKKEDDDDAMPRSKAQMNKFGSILKSAKSLKGVLKSSEGKSQMGLIHVLTYFSLFF